MNPSTDIAALLLADAAKVAAVREMAKRFLGAHTIDTTYRKDAVNRSVEGDWLKTLPDLCDIATRQRRALEILWATMALDYHPGEEPCAYCVARAYVLAILEGKP